MQPGDRLIVAFTSPVPVGHVFTAWPLHLTVVPWFRLDKPARDIAADLSDVLKADGPFQFHMAEEAQFGYGRRKTVRLTRLPNPIVAIEQSVRSYLHSTHAWIADETTKVQREFRPHVTDQKNVSTKEGDTFMCDRLSIVEQKGDAKEVVEEVRL